MELAVLLLTLTIGFLVVLGLAYAVVSSLVTRGLVHDLTAMIRSLTADVEILKHKANSVMESIEEGAKDVRREETQRGQAQAETRPRPRPN